MIHIIERDFLSPPGDPRTEPHSGTLVWKRVCGRVMSPETLACQSQKAAAPAFESAVHQTANQNSAHAGVSRAIGEESGRGRAWAPP